MKKLSTSTGFVVAALIIMIPFEFLITLKAEGLATTAMSNFVIFIGIVTGLVITYKMTESLY